MFGFHVIADKSQRDIWYHSQVPRCVPGTYAYGVKNLKCMKTKDGYRYKNYLLNLDTPVYSYGFPTSEPFTKPHGAFVFKCQLPGFDLTDESTIEEKIFNYKDTTLRRSTKKKLKVRCGKYYRIVLLKPKVTEPFCYIFGTNIRIASQKIPAWMRRRTVVLPNPLRTSRDAVANPYGFCLQIGRPKTGLVEIAGIKMQCTAIKQVCTILYEGQRYYAHPSVVHTIKRSIIV